jgi:phosphatidate cytidylyltransferase
MLPSLDAGSPLVVATFALYGLLAAASLSVKMAARGASPGMLSRQVNAWWRIFPIVTLALLAYPFGLHALAGLVCLLAVLELAPHYPDRRATFLICAAAIVLGLGALGHLLPAHADLWFGVAVGVGLLRYRIRPDAAALAWLPLLASAGAMQVLVAFTALPFDASAKLAWLFYLFILTALNDIGQFVAGKLFGRHRIAPTVSPNKTWQGLAGGIVVAQAVSFVLGAWLDLADAATMAAFGLLLSVAGFCGDLLFSMVKRRLAVKDFSQLIPGHGGILDRVDSLVLTAPLLHLLLCSTQQGPTP